MKAKIIYLLLASILVLASCNQTHEAQITEKASNDLEGEITFWHSFTQGPRKEGYIFLTVGERFTDRYFNF
ncbi:hypothetical protein OJ937_RS09725 [Staphylococcus pseudintermedius]|nr:hypothetical protein [Staphylococcus pseudintermedius]